jgi:hypothetical protein
MPMLTNAAPSWQWALALLGIKPDTGFKTGRSAMEK